MVHGCLRLLSRPPAELYSLPGYLHPLEGRFLFWLAKQVPGDGLALEVGSFKGRSSGFLAASWCQTSVRGYVEENDRCKLHWCLSAYPVTTTAVFYPTALKVCRSRPSRTGNWLLLMTVRPTEPKRWFADM